MICFVSGGNLLEKGSPIGKKKVVGLIEHTIGFEKVHEYRGGR